jgi:hypothetical protein
MDVTDMVQMSDVSGSWLQISDVVDVSGIQHKSFLTIRTRNNQPKTTHNIETIDRVDLLWKPTTDHNIQHKSFLTIRTRNNQPKTTHNIETIDCVDLLLWKPTTLKQLIVTTNDPQSCKIDTCHLEDIALGPWFLAEESVMI